MSMTMTPKYNSRTIIYQAFEKSMTSANIKSLFRKNILTERDYLSIKVEDRILEEGLLFPNERERDPDTLRFSPIIKTTNNNFEGQLYLEKKIAKLISLEQLIGFSRVQDRKNKERKGQKYRTKRHSNLYS